MQYQTSIRAVKLGDAGLFERVESGERSNEKHRMYCDQRIAMAKMSVPRPAALSSAKERGCRWRDGRMLASVGVIAGIASQNRP